MKRAILTAVIPVSLLLLACGDDPNAFHMEVGKKYVLKEWPDSAYFVAMDSVLAHEYVKAPDAPPAQVAINPIMEPVNPLKMGNKSSSSNSNKPANPVQQAVEQGAAKRQEAFAQRFQAAMDKLLADPGNSALSQMVTLNEGEDIMSLLVRVYGKDAGHLPSFVVKSQVQSLNGGSFAPGQAVKLPKL
jgi:hypothetical protein